VANTEPAAALIATGETAAIPESTAITTDLDAMMEAGEPIELSLVMGDVSTDSTLGSSAGTTSSSTSSTTPVATMPEINLEASISSALEATTQAAVQEVQTTVQQQTTLQVQQAAEAIKIRINMGLEN